MIPSERAARTVLVETVFAPDDLRAAFSQCGVIRGVYTAGCVDGISLFRYYVEYRDLEAVGYARALQFGGTAVYPLDHPGIVNHFLAVAQPDMFQRPLPLSNVLDSMAWPATPKTNNTRNAHPAKGRPSSYTIIESATSATQHPSPVPALRLPARVEFISTKDDGHCVPAFSQRDVTLSPGVPLSHSSPPVDIYMQSGGTSLPPRPPSPVSMNLAHSPYLPKRPSDAQVSGQLTMTHGQPHGLALDRLGPDEVIATLRAAANGIDGRAKWFTAGSDYYRSKDFPAAIAVLTAMIEVMLGNGLEESDLRPAILLLADCYRHLARKLGGNLNDPEAVEDSKILNAQSVELLRKVFGPSGIPSMFRDSMVAVSSTLTPPGEVPLGPSGGAINAPIQSGKPMLPNKTPPVSPAHGQVKILQREVESLRNRHRHQQDALTRERSAKRKLEDNLGSERHRRRRLEEDLKKAEKSALSARRGEEDALDRCRVEHETRRKAEGQVEELKGYIATMEPMLERGEEHDKKTKEYLRKVAISLMKAADGNLAAAPPTLKKI